MLRAPISTLSSHLWKLFSVDTLGAQGNTATLVRDHPGVRAIIPSTQAIEGLLYVF